jgi:hydroxymethylbilane synthase
LSPLRLGTRGSALALAQARWVAGRLGDVEIVEITTAGDLQRSEPASPVPGRLRRGSQAVDPGDKSRWTGALERALVAGEIDLAVHSAKDVPGELAPATAIAAVPARADARDVLLGGPSLDALAAGARVGTSSLRRRAQLLAVRPDLDVVDLRGNVDTRLRKLADGEADALVLAAAGLARLGRDDVAAAPLEGPVFVPAPGQGCLAVQARDATRSDNAGDSEIVARLDAVDDPATRALLTVERQLVARLGASCRTPVGAHARAISGGILLRAFVGLPDGSEWLIDELAGNDDLPARLAERLLTAGAMDLLRRAEAIA